jgi:predicted ArsR family transcriptional regulator
MMGEQSDARVKKMRLEEVDSFIREHKDPGVTAGEIAEAFDVTNKAASYRLAQLEEQDRVRPKTVGASAKIWFPVG